VSDGDHVRLGKLENKRAFERNHLLSSSFVSAAVVPPLEPPVATAVPLLPLIVAAVPPVPPVDAALCTSPCSISVPMPGSAGMNSLVTGPGK
jgi:hypothetical protein